MQPKVEKRFCIKFAYLGSDFYGYQRQPVVKTVENEIINALLKTKLVSCIKRSRFQSASRTDRKVSALANAIAFNTVKDQSVVMGALNAALPNIWFHSIAVVAEDFHARKDAISRWYRYLIFEHGDIKRIRTAAHLFAGMHDFKYFIKSSSYTNTVRTIDSVRVLKFQNHIAIDFKARSFGWNMIRRIVYAIQSYEAGNITIRDIEDMLKEDVSKSAAIGLAPPEYLILMDVKYSNVQFERIVGDVKKIVFLQNIFRCCKSTAEFYKMLLKKMM
jgi:tRNA pseudouridine38-40 synthase